MGNVDKLLSYLSEESIRRISGIGRQALIAFDDEGGDGGGEQTGLRDVLQRANVHKMIWGSQKRGSLLCRLSNSQLPPYLPSGLWRGTLTTQHQKSPHTSRLVREFLR